MVCPVCDSGVSLQALPAVDAHCPHCGCLLRQLPQSWEVGEISLDTADDIAALSDSDVVNVE